MDQIQYREEMQTLSGLVNEVMCSLRTRMGAAGKEVGVLDEQLMLTVCEVDLQKLFSHQ